ncbi:DUF4345 domain-containing protein [Streptomyces sp. NPDC047108]|uniref:DUF4345 domain-containing protein n=1 Tax=Streptomyces sp. NPDC047108 TaxID=3155025 RepID=UPI0033DC21D9
MDHRAARQSPVPAAAVLRLAAIVFLGGVGRLLSAAVAGPPLWFRTPLMAIELALPPLHFRSAGADERAVRARSGAWTRTRRSCPEPRARGPLNGRGGPSATVREVRRRGAIHTGGRFRRVPRAS